MNKREHQRLARYQVLISQKAELESEIEDLKTNLQGTEDDADYSKMDVETAADDMVQEVLRHRCDANDSEFQRAAEDYIREMDTIDELKEDIALAEDKLEKIETKLARFKKVPKPA